MTIYWTSEDCHGQAILTLHLSVGQVILFPYFDHWNNEFDAGGSIDAVNMDFLKAFDTVPLQAEEHRHIQGCCHMVVKPVKTILQKLAYKPIIYYKLSVNNST